MTPRKDWDRGVLPGSAALLHSPVMENLTTIATSESRKLVVTPRKDWDPQPDSEETNTFVPGPTQQDQRTPGVCSCGKICKNERGLKIHMGHMGCPPIQNLVHRIGKPCKSKENTGQETHHRARDLLVQDEGEQAAQSSPIKNKDTDEPVMTPQNIVSSERKKRIKWPKTSDQQVWRKFDEDVDMILQNTLCGSVDRKIRAMSTITYAVGRDRFGLEEDHRATPPMGNSGPNRREREIASIRKKLRDLRKQYKKAEESEKQGFSDLADIWREKLIALRKAERLRKNRKERSKRVAQFTSKPFAFLKRLYADKRSGRLQASRTETEQYLKTTYGDPDRELDLGVHPNLISPDEPTTPLDGSLPKLSEVRELLKKARSGSAPGPNGLPYKVYKQCPRLTTRLWKLLVMVWKRGELPDDWLISDGCFIPKEENSTSISQFRTISLLNVEGKLFLAILARRFTNYLLSNGYIDTSVQKGGIPGVPGCIEHTSVLSKIIQDARENKGDLTVLWLDLANAYGSIPHKLVELTLRRYHIPDRFVDLLKHYFNGFKMRYSTNGFTTDWQRLEVGIVTGCTISVVLFSAAMNLLVKSAETKSRGPVLSSGVKQPPTRAFMDDMTVTAKSVPEGRWMLEDLSNLIKWARMKFKPTKSRSLVLKKGKVENKYRFRIGADTIPTLTDNPVKSLGKWFRACLNDKEAVSDMLQQTTVWMKATDRSGLPGRFKTWCFQHGILPRILWPLLIYEVPMSTVEGLERKLTTYLRKWLGVPRSFSSVGLYGKETKLLLPISSVSEEFKKGKARLVMMLRDSSDSKVSEAKIQIKTGRKWRAAEAVEEAESRLRHRDVIGVTAKGRLGLGMLEQQLWQKASDKERRHLVQREIGHIEEEARHARAVGMRQQGDWTRWEEARPRKVTWGDMWKMDGGKLSFLLRSVYDLLPSPSNLCTWGLAESPNCVLCGKPSNLQHILSSCQVALADGRYTWRHNEILREIAAAIDIERRRKRNPVKQQQFIHFVRSGAQSREAGIPTGILSTANDWLMSADVGEKLEFPKDICTTSLRPDIVLWSRKTKQVMLIELTVPWESRMAEAHERKLAKYQPLIEECIRKGWRAQNLPVEVGSRGFPANSLWRTLGAIGILGSARKSLLSRVSKRAEDASSWIWRKRLEKWKH